MTLLSPARYGRIIRGIRQNGVRACASPDALSHLGMGIDSHLHRRQRRKCLACRSFATPRPPYRDCCLAAVNDQPPGARRADIDRPFGACLDLPNFTCEHPR